MKIPDRTLLGLDADALLERGENGGRLVIWLPRTRAGRFKEWERISTAAGAEMIAQDGTYSVNASSVRTRRRGLMDRVRGWLNSAKNAAGDRTLVLPNGEEVVQTGTRETGLLLVWAENPASGLGAEQIKSSRPECRRVEEIGSNLFVVYGLKTHRPSSPAVETTQARETKDPRTLTEQALAVARSTHDSRALASALTDFGAILFLARDFRGSYSHLEEALVLTRQLGDRVGECDVLGHLGTAAFELGDPAKAFQSFEQAIKLARETNNRFGEKLTLERLGQAYLMGNAPQLAEGALEQAVALARALADRKHEAHLRWYLGIAYAELGQRDRALEQADMTVKMLEALGSPEAACFGEHLQEYRRTRGAALPGAARISTTAGHVTTASTDVVPASGARGGEAGWLRQALSAVHALAKFVISGGHTVTPAVRERRLQVCKLCEHHTGVRCRLCGCITQTKTWLPHEHCPIGKWMEESQPLRQA